MELLPIAAQTQVRDEVIAISPATDDAVSSKSSESKVVFDRQLPSESAPAGLQQVALSRAAADSAGGGQQRLFVGRAASGGSDGAAAASAGRAGVEAVPSDDVMPRAADVADGVVDVAAAVAALPHQRVLQRARGNVSWAEKMKYFVGFPLLGGILGTSTLLLPLSDPYKQIDYVHLFVLIPYSTILAYPLATAWLATLLGNRFTKRQIFMSSLYGACAYACACWLCNSHFSVVAHQAPCSSCASCGFWRIVECGQCPS